MKILRTPENAFADLADYPFEPHYVEVAGLRMHYVEEGENANETVLMLHGEPSWSYLYRKMIPIVAQAGYRVIAPDLIGFGKSDKLTEASAYSYQQHVDWMTFFIETLDLQDITLVCQDWGGLIGLRVAAENESRFKRITAANTFLPNGQGTPAEAFLQWQEYAKTSPSFNVGKIVSGGCVNRLSPEVIGAYDAPFPDDTYKTAARIFPSLVPTSPDNPAVPANIKAWEVLQKWDKPFLTAFSDSDPITKGGDKFFQKVIPGTQGQKHITIQQGGHFLQEDKGEEWAEAIVAFIQDNQ
jgi:haloalkane dehalogenase